MANILDLAKKMGISATPSGIESKTTHSAKRRPWLEEEGAPEVEIRRGELKKQESPLKKLDKKLEKVEIKTDKILEKVARSREKSEETSNRLAINSPQTHHKTKRAASYFTYICLPPKKLPRKILDHIKKNAFLENKEWFSKIDSYELKENTGINSHQASNTIRQLRDEGFFEILDYSTAGYRLLKINPETFNLNSP